jgi:alginate O-acetyltransferase complex protein AlgI
MTFVSIEYLFFLPIVVLLYFFLPPKHRWGLLLVASYLFYAWWNAGFLILIVVSTLVDYWAGLMMGKHDQKQQRKPFLYVSLVVNLGMLFSFKYLGFCNEIIRNVLSVFETNYPVDKLDILLPVGISFYTFQTLSYTIDVYRGDREPEKHLGMFALYVSFFPQLVAGPIERSTILLPQLYVKQTFRWKNMSAGFRLILWGAFKKLLIADYLYLFFHDIFIQPEGYSGSVYVVAVLSGVIWIYADFSGYSDMAIGSARLFGIHLIPNFKRPYFSQSIAELWQRWHISLTNWVTHYISRPLLKGTRSVQGKYMVIALVFLIIGIWHGANLTFVVFGLLHGVYTIFHRLTKNTGRRILSTILGNNEIAKKGVNRLFVTTQQGLNFVRLNLSAH